jgi:hypothetical protein
MRAKYDLVSPTVLGLGEAFTLSNMVIKGAA